MWIIALHVGDGAVIAHVHYRGYVRDDPRNDRVRDDHARLGDDHARVRDDHARVRDDPARVHDDHAHVRVRYDHVHGYVHVRRHNRCVDVRAIQRCAHLHDRPSLKWPSFPENSINAYRSSQFFF